MQVEELNEQNDLGQKTTHTTLKEQLDIALNNCKMIYDPRNTMSREMLNQALDSGELINSNITLVSFIIQTCQHQFDSENITWEEGERLLTIISFWTNNSEFTQEHEIMSARIFSALCTPINLFENSAYTQIWADILECVDKYVECLINDFSPFQFPNNIQL